MKKSTSDQAVGAAKTAAGTVKKITGDLVGNPRLQATGKAQQIEGRAQRKIGQIKKVLGK